jgi:hypothetical protein
VLTALMVKKHLINKLKKYKLKKDRRNIRKIKDNNIFMMIDSPIFDMKNMINIINNFIN